MTNRPGAMGPNKPPVPADLAGALTLLRAAGDPKATEERLEWIAKQREEFRAEAVEHNAKIQEAQAILAEREAAVSTREGDVAEREKRVERQERLAEQRTTRTARLEEQATEGLEQLEADREGVAKLRQKIQAMLEVAA